MLSAKHRAQLQAIIDSSGGQALAAQAVLDHHPVDSTTPALPNPDLSRALSWRHAVRLVVKAHGDAGVCFSAGEVVLAIRSVCSLRFSCAAVAEYIRGMGVTFDGRDAVVVMRMTTGWSRTPSGTPVVVYGPTARAALAHDFEVEIPRPRVPAQLTA